MYGCCSYPPHDVIAPPAGPDSGAFEALGEEGGVGRSVRLDLDPNRGVRARAAAPPEEPRPPLAECPRPEAKVRQRRLNEDPPIVAAHREAELLVDLTVGGGLAGGQRPVVIAEPRLVQLPPESLAPVGQRHERIR